MIDRDKVMPYGMAAFVVMLVAFLVGIDVVASLPGARPEPPQESPATVNPFVIETRRDGPHHVVEAKITGPGGKAIELSLLVDTGASAIVLPSSMIGALGMDDADLAAGWAQTAGGRVASLVGRLNSVRVGDALAGDVEVYFIDDETYGPDQTPLLGMSFLGRFRFTLDDAGQRLILAPKQSAREERS